MATSGVTQRNKLARWPAGLPVDDHLELVGDEPDERRREGAGEGAEEHGDGEGGAP